MVVVSTVIVLVACVAVGVGAPCGPVVNAQGGPRAVAVVGSVDGETA